MTLEESKAYTRICDRCGHEVTQEEEYVPPGWGVFRRSNREGRWDTQWDLCPDCVSLLKQKLVEADTADEKFGARFRE